MSTYPDKPLGSTSFGASNPDQPPTDGGFGRSTPGTSGPSGSPVGAGTSGPSSSAFGEAAPTSGAPGSNPFPTRDDTDPSGAKPAGGNLLNRVVQGAHETIDRLAETAAPHVDRLEQRMDGASDRLQGQADEWTDTLRTTVRDHPLAAVGAALVLGALVARLSR